MRRAGVKRLARVAFVRMENIQVGPTERLVRTLLYFGQKVKSLRTEKGWTQTELASRLADVGVELHQTTIAKMEGGARPTTINELWALALVFDVDYADLMPALGRMGSREELEAARRRLSRANDRRQAAAEELASAEIELGRAAKDVSRLSHPMRMAHYDQDGAFAEWSAENGQ